MKKEKQFNLMMSEKDYEKLTWLAKHKGMSRGLVLRLAIYTNYHVTHNHVNTCADGHSCLCKGKRVFSLTPTQLEMEAPEESQKMLIEGGENE